jgi:hypothetical protein
VTFTLPEELRLLWQFNKELVGNLMFTIAQRTLFGVLKDPKHLGAKPGILMALHTWSRALLCHVHLHCLVTGGGLGPDGRWKKPSRDGFLAPDERLSYHFRKKFCAALEHRVKAGKVELPPDMARINALNRINAARRKTWIVDIEERYEHGHGVATYLAKYVKGGPIKNQRILHHDGETVRFRTSRKGEKFRTVRLAVGEFIGRLLEHVPPIGYRSHRGAGEVCPRPRKGSPKRRISAPAAPSAPPSPPPTLAQTPFDGSTWTVLAPICSGYSAPSVVLSP